jgi:hypothetical protein
MGRAPQRLHVNKVDGVHAGGDWALLEQHLTGANPPLHVHEDEAIYVLQAVIQDQDITVPSVTFSDACASSVY